MYLPRACHSVAPDGCRQQVTRLTTLKAALHPAVSLETNPWPPSHDSRRQALENSTVPSRQFRREFSGRGRRSGRIAGTEWRRKDDDHAHSLRVHRRDRGVRDDRRQGRRCCTRCCQSIDRLPARDTAPLRPHGRPRLHSLRRDHQGCHGSRRGHRRGDRDRWARPRRRRNAGRRPHHRSPVEGVPAAGRPGPSAGPFPSVLVLDEPTSGLDPAQRRDLRDLLQRLARAQNRTVILSTHVLAEVEAICDEVVIISGGRVVAQDRIDALRGTGSMIRLFVWAVRAKNSWPRSRTSSTSPR